MDLGKEIIKSIQIMLDRKISNYKTDKTFSSTVDKVNANDTYVILGEDGSQRTVYSSIPSFKPEAFTKVWVKMPYGSLNNMHICGIRK